MSFSSFLSGMTPGQAQLGLSALGSFSDILGYSRGLDNYYDALQQQQDQFAFQKGGYLESMRAQQEENEYQRTREGLDRVASMTIIWISFLRSVQTCKVVRFPLTVMPLHSRRFN